MSESRKLSFTYGPMGCGKSLEIIKKCHEYEQARVKFVLCKPSRDTKGDDCIKTRFGNEMRKVDYLIPTDDDFYGTLFKIIGDGVKVVIIDEAQFLTKAQVLSLKKISSNFDVSIRCYGLKNNFKDELFVGAAALMVHADATYEMKSVCKYCDTPDKGNAQYNVLFINGVFQDDLKGEVFIDNDASIEYKAMCYKCMMEVKTKQRKQ